VPDEVAGSPAADPPELLGLLVDAVEEYALFMLDPQGVVMTWNPGARRIKGFTRDEIVGRHFSAFYTDDEIRAGKPERELRRAVTEGRSRDEGWRVRKDGSRFWANVLITAVYGDDGQLEGFAKITRDETERRKVEEQARQLDIFTERERIASDLLETMVRQVFEAILAMESAAQFANDASARQHIRQAVDLLDDALKASRQAVLGLKQAAGRDEESPESPPQAAEQNTRTSRS
jgi:PAS domain S-box-containing protein